MWLCTKCGVQQDDQYIYCSKCGTKAAQLGRDWRCMKCGSLNSELFDKCVECNTEKSEAKTQQPLISIKTPSSGSHESLSINELQAISGQHEPHERSVSSEDGGFFGFATMISTTLIKVVYAIGMCLITISGILVIFNNSNNTDQGLSVLIGLGIIVVGNLIWRLVCEISILFFRIHEELVGHSQLLESIEHDLRQRLQTPVER